MKSLFAAVLVSFLLVPEQYQMTGISVPVGPLPWSLPQLPVIDIDLGLGSATFAEVQHSVTYDTLIGQIEDQDTTGGIVTGDAEAAVDEWIGTGGVLPDTSTNFETGIVVPGYVDTDAEAIATELGTNVGELMARIRGLAAIDMQINVLTTTLGVMILCLCWLLFLKVLKFSLRFVDMVISIVGRIIEAIPVVE